ncbi:hypothetical protein HNQ02_000490 [Flavobacterium sp. 7E]|uniref:hypothetical protein n=1 Tax=Flavobacterium sp. 7E TaxID=2735898 RepID=UPI001570C2A0|nr:hypothetical protein [Flavobacterium sp. 7E]NRS87583.1 hypothetical protein [Flavobacterium sp. 7E]
MNINLLSELSTYYKYTFNTYLGEFYIVSDENIIEIKYSNLEEFDVFEKITDKKYQATSFLELIFILSCLFNKKTQFSVPKEILDIEMISNNIENLKSIKEFLDEVEYNYRIRSYSEKLNNCNLLFLNGLFIFSDNSNANLPLILNKEEIKKYIA